MNPSNDPETNRTERYLRGELNPEELAAFERRLRDDATARATFRRALRLDANLRTLAAQSADARAWSTTEAVHRAKSSAPVWLNWFAWLSPRLLAAAAAGLVIGLFSASAVFGFVIQRGVERRTPLAVFEPGFENPQMPLTVGFASGTRRWSGDPARVVVAENGLQPKEGKFMLRLEPVSKAASRIFQVLDLQSLPPGTDGESRQIEISASFATAVTDSVVRYMIRAFAVTEIPEHLDAEWFDRREEAIASASKGIDVMPGTKGWQTSNMKIQVPHSARSLVLFFGVRTPDKAARTAPHYLDDVHVSLVTSGPLP